LILRGEVQFMKTTVLFVLAIGIAACARFQPTTPATDYGPTAQLQSMTMKNTSVHYDPNVLKVGTPKSQLQTTFGNPNASGTDANGHLEDVYAFNPDGSKFVDPEVRPRNIALAVFSMGTSVAVRQARLAMAEKNLTLYHVTYAPDETIATVREERMSSAPEKGPAVDTTP
jgi:hypothetical protein